LHFGYSQPMPGLLTQIRRCLFSPPKLPPSGFVATVNSPEYD
jgi:hypothetical protein